MGVGVVNSHADATKYWHHLWNLKVPPKMNHFLWRGSMGFMTCKEALLKRRIVHDTECFRCHQAVESPLHATWACGASGAVLEKAGFYSKLASGLYVNFTQFFYVRYKLWRCMRCSSWLLFCGLIGRSTMKFIMGEL